MNKYAEKVPQLVDASKKAGVEPGVLLAGISVIGGILILVFFGATILTVVATVLYPAIQSIKAIESEGENDDKEWLTYWTIFGIFSLMDEFVGFLLAFIPFYSYIRFALFVFLMAPQTKGALTIYNYVVGPILKTHKESIQAFIDEIKGSAAEAANAAKEEAKAQLNNPANLMKAAALAQEAQKQIEKIE